MPTQRDAWVRGSEALEDEEIRAKEEAFVGGEDPKRDASGRDAMREGVGAGGVHDGEVVAQVGVDADRSMDHAEGDVVPLDVECCERGPECRGRSGRSDSRDGRGPSGCRLGLFCRGG